MSASRKPPQKGSREKAAEAKKIALKEEQDVALKMMEDAGFGMELDKELPPMNDEEDALMEKQMKKSTYDSFLALIPGTAQYYESSFAEQEMDDYDKIKIERAKANDLLALTKMGRHEDALEDMMAETNNDFFFFNKLKFNMEKDGKFQYARPDLDPYHHLKQGKERNRVKKALSVGFSMLDEATEKALASMTKAQTAAPGEKKEKKERKDGPCTWRGKSKGGEYLQCTNMKCTHPYKTVVNESTGKDEPVTLAVCVFHTADCIGDLHRDKEPAKIREANKDALCGECYVLKNKKQPAKLTKELAPGVRELSTTVSKLDMKASDDGEANERLDGTGKPLTDESQCCWKPHPSQDKDLAGYICFNKVFRSPETKILYRTCAWHTKVCARHHPNGDNIVQVANEYSLCHMHHIAAIGSPPLPPPRPMPGTEPKIKREAWQIDPGHWAAPNWKCDDEVDLVEFSKDTLFKRLLEISDFDEFLDIFPWLLGKIGHRFVYMWKYYRYRNRKSKKIQAAFRMFQKKHAHLDLRRQIQSVYRVKQSLKIQCVGRRYNATKYVAHRRKMFNWAALIWQRIFRGWRTRRILRVTWASTRICKFFRRLNFLKFRDAVIMIMSIRMSFNRRFNAAVQMQKIVRGFIVRRRARNELVWHFVENNRSIKIQRFIKAWVKWKKMQVVVFVYPGDDWALRQCAKHIARLVFQLYLNKNKRKLLYGAMCQTAPTLQKTIRAFMATRGKKKMAFLREQLRNFVKPQFAVEFMQRFLDSKVFYLNQRKPEVKKRVIREPPKPPSFVRDQLPESMRDDTEVAPKDFAIALQNYYKSIRAPLLKTEQKALVRRFKNPASSKINITTVDVYISLHKVACRKHGRAVCGDCTAYEKCLIPACECRMYINTSIHADSICENCNHPPSWHRMCPLQTREKGLKLDMQSIMDAFNDKRPDLSIPSSIAGLQLKDIFVKPPDPNDERFGIEFKEKVAKKILQTSEYNSRSLGRIISDQEIKATSMPNNYEYWEQSKLDLMSPSKQQFQLMRVPHSTQTPSYEVTPEQFWSYSAKNPNKRPRDYNELFSHAMPLPIVVEGQLKYSMEGSKLYLNILVEITNIEDHINHDDPQFLRLVINHAQIFERHWRKMVADIRKGKLNRNLPVSKEARLLYEASHLPRPDLAAKLDNTFRTLGFHKKVLGKDITMQSYASKKLKPVVDPKERRPSLPTLNLLPGHLGATLASLTTCQFIGSAAPPSPKAGGRATTPSSALRDVRTPNSRGKSVSIMGTDEARTISSADEKSTNRLTPTLTPPSSRHKMTDKEKLDLVAKTFSSNLLEEFKGQMKDMDVRGPSRNSSRGSRRGSDTDILRPAKMPELQEIEYESMTAPRDTFHLVAMSNNKVVCPFPACGRAFASQDAAFAHLPSHEQRKKLAAATPLPDALLNFYWPEGAPWQAAEQFVSREIPPGSLPCPYDGCTAALTSQDNLKSHLKLAHALVSLSHISKGYVTTKGGVVAVPPHQPPRNAPIPFCERHVSYAGTCWTCIELEKAGGPVQPFKWFEFTTIDLSATCRAAGGGGKNIVGVSRRDPRSVLSFAGKAGTMRGELASVCVDRGGDVWACMHHLYSYDDCVRLQLPLARDFDRAYELYSPLAARVASGEGCGVDMVGSMMSWVPVFALEERLNVSFEDKNSFRSKMKSGEIPKRNHFFVRA